MTERPRVSVVVPACNEGEGVISVFDRLFESVRLPSEVLVVVDSAEVPGQYLRAGTCQRHQVRHRRGERAGGRGHHGGRL